MTALEIIAVIALVALPAVIFLVFAIHTGESSPAQPTEVIRYTQAGYKSNVTGYHQGREVKANLYQDKG